MRTSVPQQSPRDRRSNFSEVSLGFAPDAARAEASRCLQCKNAPCSKGCPVAIDIPAFIKLIKEGMRGQALAKIKERNNLPAVCGRVCPQEDQCEKNCVLQAKNAPINIGALERFAADAECEGSTVCAPHRPQARVDRSRLIRVAVAGSGPAGLTAAADLAHMGYAVTLFESLHVAGGVLVYGIPEFRLPKRIVAGEVDYIRSLGVEVRTDVLVGASIGVDELFAQGYRALFVATGAGLPQFLGIPGENIPGVYSANEFLARVNLMKAYDPAAATPLTVGARVAVVGGGNVAFDCSRVALRLGAHSTIVYRRTEAEMPARAEEIHNAKEEGVVFNLLTQPLEVLAGAKGVVRGIRCLRMELGAPDASGRRRPVPVAGSEFEISCDTLIVAIGQNPNPLLMRHTPAIRTSAEGTIIVDEELMTSMKGVFAGGDIATGADTVIKAMGAGKRAAVAVDRFIKSEGV